MVTDVQYPQISGDVTLWTVREGVFTAIQPLLGTKGTPETRQRDTSGTTRMVTVYAVWTPFPRS